MRIGVIALATLTSTIAFAGPAPKSAGSKDGRFQIVQISNFRRDQFLIDTHTGKLWRYTCLVPEENECGKAAWMAEEIEGITKSKSDLFKDAIALERFMKEQKETKKEDVGEQ